MSNAKRKPNILFAFADDWGRYASAYAHLEGPASLNHLISTPHFDRIAKEGCLFTNALVPAPSCTPCRSSVLSGRYFWQTGLGAILNGAVWDRQVPSFPFALEKNGYHIGFSYKVWSPGTPNDDPYGGIGNRYQEAGRDFGHFSEHVTQLHANGSSIEAAKQTLYDETLGNFESFLAKRETDQAFCYWWGPTNTHRTWERGSGKQLWNLEPDDLKGKLPAFLPDVHEVREDVADYLGECMAFDAGLGVLMNKLEAMGELDNTFIVVSGDHGIPGFPRAKCNLYNIGCEVALAARLPGVVSSGIVIDDLVNIMDLAPSFLDIAGAPQPSFMPAKSLMPLMQATQSGQIDPERSWVIGGRERHVANARELGLPYPQRSIRTHRYHYIRNFAPERWPMGDPKGLDNLQAEAPSYDELTSNTRAAYADMDASPSKAWMIHHRAEENLAQSFALGFGKRPAEELYDLEQDPSYMQNLADDPAHQDIKQHLSTQLIDELHRQQDPRVVEQDCRYEQSPYTDLEAGAEQAAERQSRAGSIPQ